MEISSENRALARYLRDAFGGQPTVASYWDDAHHSRVDVMTAPDVPTRNVRTYATLGLSDHDIGRQANGRPLRVEMLMAARDYFDFVPNALSTCAFNVINSGKSPEPGVIFPRVIELYQAEAEMPHIFLFDPFIWPLETRYFDSKVVAWLLGVPISEPERLYALANGPDALSSLFERHQIDVFDLQRPSVV